MERRLDEKQRLLSQVREELRLCKADNWAFMGQREEDLRKVQGWREEVRRWEERWKEEEREKTRRARLLHGLMREVQAGKEGGREREKELEDELDAARRELVLYGEEIASLRRLARRMEEEGGKRGGREGGREGGATGRRAAHV